MPNQSTISKRQRKFVQEFDQKLARILELESYSQEELTHSEYTELLTLRHWFDVLDNTRCSSTQRRRYWTARS